MKLKLCLLLLLCPFFPVLAQPKPVPVSAVSVGQQVPDMTIPIANYEVDGRPISRVKLSAFAGRLLILDFWATWCAPCRAMIPRMDSLQKAFQGKVQFLPVTYQSAAVIAPVIKAIKQDKNFDLPEVTDDKVLNAMFPHRTLPHYVWIDGNGTVRAITEFKEVNAVNIQRFLSGGKFDLPVKTDLVTAYRNDAPLLINGNGGDGSTVRYHSILSGYLPGIAGGLQITAFDPVLGQKFTVRNAPFVNLCKFMFQDDGRYLMNAQVKIYSKDSLHLNSKLSGQAYDEWEQAGNAYSYELLLPPALATHAFSMMQQDLQRLFPQYAVSIGPQQTRCLALVRIPGSAALTSTGQKSEVSITPYSCKLVNASMAQLMVRLKYQFLQNSPLPVIDLTGYQNRVDLSFNAKLWDVVSLNRALKPFGLEFKEQNAMVDILVIRDSVPLLTKNLNP